jgi:formylglycine-generating enzyme required for sulfatase activity
MALLLKVVGSLWALIGATNIFTMPAWHTQSTVALALGLVFNMVLFVLPGLGVYGIGAVLGRRQMTSAAQNAATPSEIASSIAQKKVEGESKKCTFCQKEIDSKARKCPYCQADFRSWHERHVDWCKRHPIVTVSVFLIWIYFGFIHHAPNSNSPNTALNQEPASSSQAASATGQNNPTIKQISIVPADFVGKSFDMTVNAKADKYYNYGFADETKYYSLLIWDDSTSEYSGVYAYLEKSKANKALFDNLINGPAIIKIHGGIPSIQYEAGSNAFFQIYSWGVGSLPKEDSAAELGKVGIQWVTIPGGTFTIQPEAGGDDESERHVTIKSFQMAKTLVTNKEYKACVAAGACSAAHVSDGKCSITGTDGAIKGNLPNSFQGDDQPVVCVDWNQAKTFSKWVGGRLPSQDEWEYAARSGGLDRDWPWGKEDATCEQAVIDEGGPGCGRNATWPVCSKPAGNTVQGLCDMVGNVGEWTTSFIRGGGWNVSAGNAWPESRLSGSQDSQYDDLGFRPARSN